MKNYKVALIKIKENTQIYENAEKFMKKGFKYFVDSENLYDVVRCLIFYCNDTDITTLHWCECEYNKENNEKNHLLCKVLYSSKSSVVIRNACDSIFLDIESDFKDQYIGIETSSKLFNQFEQLINRGHVFPKRNLTYGSIISENNLNKLAQKNEYCIRQYDLKEPTADGRSEYQRDYDRIIYSKSFRKLVDKTQVFSATKGDHYRTRMTHTMIVCQIARSICNALNFNQALTESIAIAHDLGHTPFGHVGERTLDNILQNRF